MECEFCKKKFSSKSNLACHQKTAKYCQKLRNEIENIEEKFECKYCEQIFSRNFGLQKHMKTCKERGYIESEENIEKLKNFYNNQINKIEESKKEQKNNYESIIKSLEKQIQDSEKIMERQIQLYERNIEKLQEENVKLHEHLATSLKKTININQQINNHSNNDNSVKKIESNVMNMLSPLSITSEEIGRIFKEEYTEDVFVQSQEGLADFCFEKIIKANDDKYHLICTDHSRKIFYYITLDGLPQKDIKAFNFIELIQPHLKKAIKKIIDKAQKNNKIFNRTGEIINNRTYNGERILNYNGIYNFLLNLKFDNSEFLSRLSIRCSNIPFRKVDTSEVLSLNQSSDSEDLSDYSIEN
jgi:predicted RNase H-like nuclease (RuvC/YqgF family)